MTHTQWGTVWGISFFPMILFTLFSGMYADRVGTRSIVAAATLLMGVAGIARAYAQDFNQLCVLMFILGIGWSLLMPSLPKSLAHWFSSRELGLANGILIAGICVGSGSAMMISGVYLAPRMGGWRNVMWLYGTICVVLGIIWALVFREAPDPHPATRTEPSRAFLCIEALSSVIRIRDLWLLNASRFCICGALFGVIGFLPALLHAEGMDKGLAHLSSSLIYYVNILGVLAMPMLSDRYANRKIFIWPFSLLSAFFIFLLSWQQGMGALVLCGAIGLSVGFIPLLITMPMEMDGVKQRYVGTALGLSLTAGNVGSFIGPVLGGKMMDVTGSDVTAFILWSILMAVAALFILPMKETGIKTKVMTVMSSPLE